MDIYCIARMFKKTIPISNIITYTGAFHMDNYIDFIENYLHVKPILSYGDSYGDNNFYIDVSEIKNISDTKSFIL